MSCWSRGSFARVLVSLAPLYRDKGAPEFRLWCPALFSDTLHATDKQSLDWQSRIQTVKPAQTE